MIGSPKKATSQAKRTQKKGAKSKGAIDKTDTTKSAEQLQDNANLQVAQTIIRQILTEFRTSGADKSLIEILKTVRHWPSRLAQTDATAFAPPFNATDISAEEVAENGDTITRVSFSYAGERYDFIATISSSSSSDFPFGNISLHENGDQVIDMKIVQNEKLDDFGFRELEGLNFGPWIENIVAIEAEIKQHHLDLANKMEQRK